MEPIKWIKSKPLRIMTFNQTYLFSICILSIKIWYNLCTDEIVFKYSLAQVKVYILVALIDIQAIFENQ